MYRIDIAFIFIIKSYNILFNYLTTTTNLVIVIYLKTLELYLQKLLSFFNSLYISFKLKLASNEELTLTVFSRIKPK